MSSSGFVRAKTGRRRRGKIAFDVDVPAMIAANPHIAAVHAGHVADGFELVTRRRRVALRRDDTVRVTVTWRKRPSSDLTLTITDSFPFKFQRR